MFRRRQKQNLAERAREAVWPRAGWRRSTRYLFRRLARIKGSPYTLAAGFASGAAVSFTPFVGLHFIASAVVAWIIRANVVSALIGTAVGNPWTLPFIWIWIYNLGVWIGMGSGETGSDHPDFSHLFGEAFDALLRFDMMYLAESAWPIISPMLVGSVPTMIVVWMAFYFALKPMIAAFQDRRVAARHGPRQV
jgi:uncharacterized protein (DUF2062 family)